jgi:hypothetical protein
MLLDLNTSLIGTSAQHSLTPPIPMDEDQQYRESYSPAFLSSRMRGGIVELSSGCGPDVLPGYIKPIKTEYMQKTSSEGLRNEGAGTGSRTWNCLARTAS